MSAEERIGLPQALAKLTGNAAAVLGIDAGQLRAGAQADLCLFDPRAAWVVDRAGLCSQGKHTPYLGHELTGRVVASVVAGRVAFGPMAPR